MMSRPLLGVAMGAWMAAAGATVAMAGEAGRYVVLPVEGGLIRMDSATGSLSLCRPERGVWQCRSLNDIDDEVSRLRAENQALKARIEAAEAGRKEPPALPSDADLARVFGVFETMMRRFVDFARSLEAS